MEEICKDILREKVKNKGLGWKKNGMEQIKAIIFDMDGTIFDTEKLYFDLLIQVLDKYGIKKDAEYFESLVGISTAEMLSEIEKMVGDECKEDFKKDYQATLVRYITKFGTPLKAGVENLINYALVTGIKLGICTSATKELFELNFCHSGLQRDNFDFVLTLEDVKKAKPSSEIYEKGVQIFQNKFADLKIKAENCLVIEDSYVGVEAGKGAGCVVAKIKDLERSNAEKDKMANLKFYNLNEVINFLKFLKIDCSKEDVIKGGSPEVMKIFADCKKRVEKLNKKVSKSNEKRQKYLQKLFCEIGENAEVKSPFYCDKGVNIKIGKNFFANFGVVMLDGGEIVIGDDCRFGPYSGIYNVGHAFEPNDRRKCVVTNKKVYIGNNVWIGACSVILAGVKVGDNAIIGAGSVVTKDVMPNTVVAGNPAKFVKFIL